MTDKQQGINDLDKYLRGKGGANFEKYYKAGVSGLTDIDLVYVKNGCLIFNEEKTTSRDILPLNYAQFMLFKAIQELKPEKTRCYISVFKDNEVFIFNIMSLIFSSLTPTGKSRHKVYEPWVQVYPLSKADHIFDEKQYYTWFANQCKECENGFK